MRRWGLLAPLLAVAAAGCSSLPSPAPPRALQSLVHPALSTLTRSTGRDAACRGLSRAALQESTRLRVGPGGIAVLASPTRAVPVAYALGHPGHVWTPPTPLPAASPGRRVDVFYSPHPDDETLSMGVLIAADVQRGDRVIVVALTDGRATRVGSAVDARLRATGDNHRLSAQEIGDARFGEMRRAVAALGVAPRDLYAAHLDGPGSDCHGQVTVGEAMQVIRAFALRFPGATHVTMSYTAERHPDHLAAGVALANLTRSHLVTHSLWVVSRLWWQLPMPRWHWALPGALRPRVEAAAQAYGTWAPVRHEYAIGFTSVKPQFQALMLDPRNLVHGLGALVPGYPTVP